MNLDTGDVTTLASFAIVLLVHAVVISRWSARLDTIVKKIQEEIVEIRMVTVRHDKDIEQLKIGIEVERQVRAYVDRMHNGVTTVRQVSGLDKNRE